MTTLYIRKECGHEKSDWGTIPAGDPDGASLPCPDGRLDCQGFIYQPCPEADAVVEAPDKLANLITERDRYKAALEARPATATEVAELVAAINRAEDFRFLLDIVLAAAASSQPYNHDPKVKYAHDRLAQMFQFQPPTTEGTKDDG